MEIMDSKPVLENGSIRLKQCRHGSMIYLKNDLYIGRSLDLYGEFSEGEADMFRQMIRPDWTVLEVGANIGSHTVQIAKLVGPRGVVHVFEPQRVVFQILCANVALNSLNNVYTHHAAVGREAGSIVVPLLDSNAQNNFGGLGLGNWEKGDRVPVMTIDSMNLINCHLVKIDVEGMEGEVIAGAEQTLRRGRPVLYLENDRGDKSAALIRQLLALEYRLYWHLPMMFNSQNYFGATENVFPGIVSVNMLGIHASLPQKIDGLREITNPDDKWQG
jgi:FkbM family methyltransferase